jgi:hypothetical protein
MRAQGSFGFLDVARRQRPPLVIHLARRDSSVVEWSPTCSSSQRPERLGRHMPAAATDDALGTLRWMAAARTPAIVIGSVAGVLQGGSQPPVGGWVEIVSGDLQASRVTSG